MSGVECAYDSGKGRAVCKKPTLGLQLTAHQNNASLDEWNTIDMSPLIHPRDGVPPDMDYRIQILNDSSGLSFKVSSGRNVTTNVSVTLFKGLNFNFVREALFRQGQLYLTKFRQVDEISSSWAL